MGELQDLCWRCGSSRLTEMLAVSGRVYVELLQCQDCGLLQSEPRTRRSGALPATNGVTS